MNPIVQCDFPECQHIFMPRKIHEVDCRYDGRYTGCGCNVQEDYIYHIHCDVEGCNKTTFHIH